MTARAQQQPVCRAVRWIPFVRANGPQNMAADEVLLEAAAAGSASLRFYGWSQPTVSLGYFQAADVRLQQPGLASLPWVRRPSGGKTLVHHHELTYALGLPPGFRADWMARMHRYVILPALERLDLAGAIHVVDKNLAVSGDFLCFQQQTPGDLVCSGRKVVGSAQRKHRHCLLQHGAILLSQSVHTPELPGLKELTGVELSLDTLQEAILTEFERTTGWSTTPGSWTEAELRSLEALANTKYANAAWNERR